MKRIIAVLVSLCLVFTVMPISAVCAEDGSGGESAGDKVCRLFTVGDSTTTGYGLPDSVITNYSYAIGNNDLEGSWTYDAAKQWNEDPGNLTRGRMSAQTFSWRMKKYLEASDEYDRCVLSSLCIDGMMASEFRAMLDPEYYRKTASKEDEVYGEGSGIVNMLTPRYIGNLYNGGATDGKTYEALHEYVTSSVKDADVVVMDLCMNNFALYMVRRIAALTGSDAYNSRNYTKVNAEDIEDLSERTRSTIKVLRDELTDILGLEPMAKGLVDAMLYTYADCVTNFSADVKLVRQMNPDAKIIACGLYNPVSGYSIKVDGREVDLGKLYGVMIKAVDSYIRAVDDNSPYYYYADIPDDLGRVEDLFKASQSYEDLISTPGGATAMEYIYQQYGEVLVPGGAAELYKDKIKRLFYESSKYSVVEENQLAGDDVGTEKQIKELGDYFRDGTLPSASTMVSLHLMANLIMLHPSEAGCAQKYEAVREAYEKEYTAYEETLRDVIEVIRRVAGKAGISSISDLMDIAEIADMLPALTIDELIAIGGAVYGLPDLEKELLDIIDDNSESTAELEDKVLSQGIQISMLTARTIDVNIVPSVKISGGRASYSLSWEGDPEAAGYEIRINGKEVRYEERGGMLVYEDPAAVIGASYKYEITPYVVCTLLDEPEKMYGRTFKGTVAPRVTVKKAKLRSVRPSDKALTVKWKAVSGADGYQVYSKAAGKKAVIKTVSGGKKLSRRIGKLKKKTKYTVKVRAYRTVNGKKYYGAWSAVKKAKTR